MSCVDKDSKTYKDLCTKYNTAPNHMEIIFHSWWVTHGDDGSTPTDSFIKEKLYGKSVEMSDNDILVAENNDYFSNKSFNNREEAAAYYRRLSSMYPKDAIGSYTDSEGNVNIVLAKPVISSESKYKNFEKPTVGSVIDMGEGPETVTKVTKRTATEFIAETEKGFRSINIDDNGNFVKRDGTRIKVEGAVPYYNEYPQSSTPTSTINIYAGTGENAHLSNFAERPFVVDSSMLIRVDGNLFNLFTSDTEFNSVEQAFQAAKIAFAYDGTENAIDDDTASSFERRIQQATPAQAKSIGRQIPMSKKALDNWNKHKEEVMKMLIKASFEQNPEALKQLLVTGDTTLTHIQDKGEWGTLFPKLLMEVRDELRGQADYLSIVSPMKKNLRKIDSLIDTLPKLDNRYFKNLDEVIEFIGTLDDYNPRLKALSDFLKKTKQEGKSLTKVEYDAMMSLLRETGIKIEDHLTSIEELHSGKISTLRDYSAEPIMVGVEDVYFDHTTKDTNRNNLTVKEVKDGMVTFSRSEFTREGKKEVEGTVTVSEEEFRRLTGRTGSDFRFMNLYGFADVYVTTLITENGNPLYSLEVSIPDKEQRGKGHGLEIYESVIEELASRGAYLTPGNVVPSNHVWEALERRGRVKEVKLANDETVIIALPKTPINDNQRKEEYGQRRIYSESISAVLGKRWKSISRGTEKISGEEQQREKGDKGSDPTGRGRLLDDVVKEASRSLDKELEERGIVATKQPVRVATPKEFHKAISEEKVKNPDGFMVDVHEESDYENDLLLITEDGKSGIAVTPDGDIVSVFSSVKGDHRLDKLMFMAIAAGGKKLDCFYLDSKSLPYLYAKFGFKVAATVPFNAEQYKPEGYDEWQAEHPDRKVLGVAAMYLEESFLLDSYSPDRDPNIEGATVFNGESGYDEALEARDRILNNIEKAKQQYQQTQQEQMAQEKKETPDEDQGLIDRHVALSKSLTNLQTSNVMTTVEAQEVATQIVNWVSDRISEIQEGNEETLEKYKEQLKGIDTATASRIEIARAIGIKTLLKDCNEAFFSAQKTGKGLKTLMKLEVIKNNWNALVYSAESTFMENEKFSVSSDGTIIEETDENADNINDSKSTEEIQEVAGSAQENWQMETRTRDILEKASAIVKDALRRCYKLDENGNPEQSEFGINKRVDMREAINSILSWTDGSLDIYEMTDRLEAQIPNNPWIKQIVERLKDPSGKEADFKSQFFVTFCQRKQLYGVVRAERDTNGKVTFKSIPVNRSPALRDAYNSVANQFKIGEHPMFTSKGVNKTALSELSETLEELKASPEKSKQDKLITFAFHSLGYYTTESEVAEVTKNKKNVDSILKNLGYIVDSLEKHKEDENYQPFVFSKDTTKGSIYGNLRGILKPLTDRLEDTAISSFYENGKMYQTYTLPSYMTNLLAKFRQKGDKFDKFIKEQYGDSEWFKRKGTDIGSGWRCPWLDRIVNDEQAKSLLDHKVQLAFDKQAYMTEMGDLQYTMSILAEYFSESVPNGATEVPAWFRVPMLSNKSSSEFIKFYKYVGTEYKDSIVKGMIDIMSQEIARIRTVNIRNLDKNSKGFIKNWDTKGKEFNMLTFLNSYLKEDNTEFGELLRKAVSKEGITKEETKELIKKAKKVIKDEMQKKVDSILKQFKDSGIVEAAASIENAGKSEADILSNLENFIWNDAFAAMNILELTISDPAFYSGAVDLQKRFAQIHAPGVRPNVYATDYDGNRVSDSHSRTIVLSDFKGLTSNIIENLEIVFDRKIESAKSPAERAMYENMKANIIEQFKDINMTDAQAYNSPTSYRKKAILFGRWNKQKEDIYQRLMEGKYTFSDLETAFGEVLKPFVYTQAMESVGKEGSPIQNMPIPFQNKNSEYLLIMADAILKGEDTGRPNMLRAIYEVMEESAKSNPTKGIDTVQFDSAVKSGLHDPINIGQFMDKEGGERLAKEHLLNSIYAAKDGKRSSEYSSSVRKIEWMDYGLQQEVPQHFNDHEQAHGSQIRAITGTELSPDVFFNVEGRKLSAKEFADEFEHTVAENIQESLEELEKEFRLKGTRKERNIALAKILEKELATSSRYGIDLKQACLLNEDGEFNIPIGDPIQAKRIEQLINSVIKNRVNKQTIAGGPVVQVTNFGTSKELNIRFKDKSGTLLKTRAEFEGTDAEYRNYIKENQAGIAYLEVYAPIYANDLFNRFADESGNIDVEAIEKVDPDLLKMVGYRIPTEDKYSCAPIKIVGFLPREAGDGIMLPAEITLLSGSDFDVDKIYLMRKVGDIVENRSEIHKDLFKALSNSQDKYESKKALHELIDQFLDRPYDKGYLVNQDTAEGFLSMTEESYNRVLDLYEKARRNPKNLKARWPKDGKGYRDNKIVDMTYEVLTHEDSTDKILNPGGFEPQKRLGYMVAAKKALGNKATWEQLESISSIDKLKELSESDQNLAFIDTHIQFYKQNSAAAALIGMFAVHKVAHALLERDPLYVAFLDAADIDVPINLGTTVLGGLVKIDPTRDTNQALIGKSLGSLVASAADAAKDPVLNLMNINKDTANILNIAIRLGVPFDDAALLLSQRCVSGVIEELNQRRLRNEPASLQGVINDRLKALKESNNLTDKNSLNTLLSTGLSKEQLIDGLTSTDTRLEIIALSFIQAFLNTNKELKGVTLATRFNSISNATGPLIVDNLIMEHKIGQFSEHIRIYNEKSQTYEEVNSIQDILDLHPMLKQFSKGYEEARDILRDSPLYGYAFNDIVNLLDTLKVESIIKDRENLSKFADYFSSYLLIANNVVDPTRCSYYVNDFAKEFFYGKENYKEKYRGNPLIDAIKLDIDSKSGLASLKVDITGLSNKQKDVFISGFTDLLTKDKELAIELFNYNFFRGGLGFTPKTFMSLTPTLLKQSIEGYNSSFSESVAVDPTLVVDLFIRNNWRDSNFVKYLSPTHKELKDGELKDVPNFSIDSAGNITVTGGLFSAYDKQGYVRTKINGEDVLLKQVHSNKNSKTIIYKEVKPLGGNNAYLEFTSTPIKVNDNISGQIDTNGVSKKEAEDDPMTPDDGAPDMSNIRRAFELTGLNSSEVDTKLSQFKGLSSTEQEAKKASVKAFLAKQYAKLNIPFNENTLEEDFKKLC